MPSRKEIAEQSRQMRLTDDQIAEQTLSPQALARDRASTSRDIVFNIGEWQHRTSVVDYRGADVRRTPIEHKKRKSVEDLADDPLEAERILSYVNGDRAVRRHTITDFDSFKEAFRDAFTLGGKGSHARLWDTIGGQDDLLLKLYAHTKIQDQVTRNSKESRVLDLMSKYKIPRHQANGLYEQIRIHEIQLVQEGMLPVAERQIHVIPETLAPTSPPSRLRISQATRTGGKVYQRAKPVPYTIPQMRFLRNNGRVPTRKVTAQFNILFQENRTQNSIYNKRYRLLKSE
jgi:hypothetical protein